MKKIRDPKINPVAGDVVVKTAGNKKFTRRVESSSAVGKGTVSYRHRGLLFYATMESWRRWCAVECIVTVWGDAQPSPRQPAA